MFKTGRRVQSRKDRSGRDIPYGTNGKEPAYQCRRPKRRELDIWLGKIP